MLRRWTIGAFAAVSHRRGYPGRQRCRSPSRRGKRRIIGVDPELFDRNDTPYEARPRPDKAPRFSDYEHLARVREWAVAGEEEQEPGL